MLCIGLTGGSGSGKSTVAEIFSSCGALILDADAVYHSLISGPSDCVLALSQAFGEGILSKDGGIDRKKLADTVFEASDRGKERLSLLNEISHRFVRAECEARLATWKAEGQPLVVLDVPLLFQSGFDKMCDATVAVLAPYALRLARITARDGLEEAAAKRRLDAQPADSFYRSHADFILENDGDFRKLRDEALSVLERIKEGLA